MERKLPQKLPIPPPFDASQTFSFQRPTIPARLSLASFKKHEIGSPERKIGIKTVVSLLGPFAPHIANEMWEILGSNKSLDEEDWLEYDKKVIIESRKTVEVPVTVNGKLRARIKVESGLDKNEIIKLVRENESLKPYIKGEVIKEIYIPDKILNLVVREG